MSGTYSVTIVINQKVSTTENNCFGLIFVFIADHCKVNSEIGAFQTSHR